MTNNQLAEGMKLDQKIKQLAKNIATTDDAIKMVGDTSNEKTSICVLTSDDFEVDSVSLLQMLKGGLAAQKNELDRLKTQFEAL